MALLEARGVSFSYGRDLPLILRDVSVSVDQGDTITLLGPNGVGKTTLLNILCGLLRPDSGSVLLDGRDIRTVTAREIALHIAYVPQRLNLMFDYTVLDYVLLGRTAHLSMISMPSERDREIALGALDRLELADYRDRIINNLSGGEQQKVSIARALAQEPRIIILDEPTSALDYGNQAKVLDLVQLLSRDGYAVLMTTHNPDHPLLLGAKTWLLSRGGSLQEEEAERAITNEALTALYGSQVMVADVEALGRKACFIRLNPSPGSSGEA